MTEQEFRDKLKQCVGHTELSSDRQYRVLAEMKGERSRMRTWGKMKIALAVVLIVLLMAGGAVAGGRSLVDWHGKPISTSKVQTDRRMLELMDWRAKGKWASIQTWDEERGTYTGILASGLDVYAPSLDKLRAWVMADGTLPWLANIPAEYQMSSGSVQYACEPAGEIRLRSQETTEDGYILSYFEMPTEHRFIASYTIYLADDERRQLQIQVTLIKANEVYGLPMEDGSIFTELNVEGMQRAIAIESAGVTRVALHKEVRPALPYKSVTGYPETNEWLDEYDCLEIGIIGQGTPADLLAIFGLTAQ